MNARRGKPTQGEQGLLEHVRRAEAGKVPLAQYCRAHGLNVQSVYNLRSRLAMTQSGPRRRVPKSRKPARPFVAVRVATAATPPSAACRLQVKGWVIECASLPTAEWLAGLVAGDADAVP